jgi:hypothetical protein
VRANDDLPIEVSKQLPAFEQQELDPDAMVELMMGGLPQVLLAVYAKHFGLSGRLRLSLYHLTPISLGDEDGFGAMVGPRGMTPVAVVAIMGEDELRAIVSQDTQTWLDRFGEGEMPSESEEIDFDKYH